MKRAIFINAFRRPKYLYVVLDSLRRCKGIDGWDVWVSIDGGSNASFDVCENVLPHRTIRHTLNLGPRDHPTAILQAAVAMNYDWVLYGEEDSLYRSDTLEWLLGRTDREGWISCFHHPDGVAGGYEYLSFAPVLLRRSDFVELVDFMERRRYVGLPNVTVHNEPIRVDERGHDICWYAMVLSRKKINWYAEEPMTLNFGYQGYDHKDGGAFESAVFQGDPSYWMELVLRYCAAHVSPHLGTVGFQYR